MNLFLYLDYRKYLEDYIKSQPRNGYGTLSKMAKALAVHPTLMTLILSGDRDLSQEQAYDLCEYLSLSDLETEYFVCLIQYHRAGNERFKKFIEKKLNRMREQAGAYQQILEKEVSLSDQQKDIFYSSWLFAAVHLFTSFSQVGKTIEEIQDRFSISPHQALEVLNFLAEAKLVEVVVNRYQFVPMTKLIDIKSSLLLKHHTSWRAKKLFDVESGVTPELMLTQPFAVSKNDFNKIHESLLETVAKFSDLAKGSAPEELACLHIDFFKIQK